MSHVTHMNESCHMYEWVMSHIWMNHVHTQEWVMIHVRMGHGLHMDESCYSYEWAVVLTWMRRITNMNESCHTYEWSMSHVWMVHVTRMNDPRHTYQSVMSHMCECVLAYTSECVLSHTEMSHIVHKIASCHTHKWVMVHIYMSHGTHINEPCRLDSFTSVPWLTYMRTMPLRMCDMTHSCVWYDSFVCVTWLMQICAMTNSHMWDMTHPYVWIRLSIHAHEGVTPEAQQHWHAADYVKWASLALWRTWPPLEHLLARSWEGKKAC